MGVLCLLGQLCPLDDVLDGLLLRLALLVIAPPQRPLVLALETEVFARLAARLSFVALLPSETASEAAWSASAGSNNACIFVNRTPYLTVTSGAS